MVQSTIHRILKSVGYAWQGIRITFVTQQNFKIHCAGFVFMNLSAWYFSFETWEYIICLIISAMVFSSELFNTAIESTVNLHSPQLNPLAKIAKDCAAAAVLVFAICAVSVWLIIVYNHWT